MSKEPLYSHVSGKGFSSLFAPLGRQACGRGPDFPVPFFVGNHIYSLVHTCEFIHVEKILTYLFRLACPHLDVHALQYTSYSMKLYSFLHPVGIDSKWITQIFWTYPQSRALALLSCDLLRRFLGRYVFNSSAREAGIGRQSSCWPSI
jgi:hypothetical protein